MTTEFNQFHLHPQLVQAVVERGYAAPTPIQSAVIPVMIAGADVIGQAQTGTGKTAAFALPILQNLSQDRSKVQSLVVTPTRELALQVAGAISEYGAHLNARVLAVYGGQAYAPQLSGLKRGADVVVGTPGRLLDLIQRDLLHISAVRTVVLDEADEMLSMGFIEDIEAILAKTPQTRQTALFSATMPPEIRRLAERYMIQPRLIAIQREQVTVETTEQRYYLVHKADRLAALTRLFEMEDITSALIFVRMRGETGELANELTVRGYPAEPLSGDLSQEARERTLARFRQNQIKVLVATDVAARGLDIDDISHVFNYELPEDPEVYVHRIGRTGRAGKTGIAISLLSPSERRRLSEIERFCRCKLKRAVLPTDEDIRKSREERLLQQVTTWLRRGRCLRERELVNALVEQGHDPLAIAAAALKMARAEEKQRPIAPLAAEPEPEPALSAPALSAQAHARRRSESSRLSRFGRWDESAHEPGMVRLTINIGKKHGIRPNDIVGAIAAHASIPGSVIGKIHIQQQRTSVDVPEEFAARVLAKAGETRIRRLPVEMQRS